MTDDHARRTRSFAEKLGLLSELTLFAGLSEADMTAIGHATTMTHCVRGQQILSPDDAPDRIHIIKRAASGSTAISPDGKQLTLDIFEKGTILGDMSLLGQDRISEAYAEAIDDGVICTITPDELRRLIERYPVIGVNIIRHLSRRLQAAERELEAMAYQRVDQRLARSLLDLGQRFGVGARRAPASRPASPSRSWPRWSAPRARRSPIPSPISGGAAFSTPRTTR